MTLLSLQHHYRLSRLLSSLCTYFLRTPALWALWIYRSPFQKYVTGIAQTCTAVAYNLSDNKRISRVSRVGKEGTHLGWQFREGAKMVATEEPTQQGCCSQCAGSQTQSHSNLRLCCSSSNSSTWDLWLCTGN